MQPGNQRPKIQKEEKKFFSELLFKYAPYWPIFLVLMAIAMFGAWFYLRSTPKLYEAYASIMIRDESKGTQISELEREMNTVTGSKLIENETEVLKSKTLMYDVVKHLHIYAQFFEDGELVPASAYTTSPVTIEAVNSDLLKKAEKVEFNFTKDSMVVIGSNKYKLNEVVSTPYGDLKFVPNKKYSTPAVKPLYFTLKNAKSAAGSYSSKLKVEGSKVSTVISMNQRDEAPERAEDILRELIVVYNRATSGAKNRIADSTSAFLGLRINEVGGELNAIEEKIKNYKSKGAVELSAQSQIYLNTVSQTDQKTVEADMQITMLDQIDKYIQSKDGGSISPSTLGLKDPVLSDLLNRLTDRQLTYERQLKANYGVNHPDMKSLSAEIVKLKGDINDNIKSQRASINASKLNLNSTNNQLTTMLQSIPEKERDLIEISREQEIKKKIYAFLLEKKEASDLARYNFEESRVVEKPQAIYDPVAPKSSMMYMVAVIIALALPVGFIAIKGMFARKVSFRQEIENLVSFPIIGEVMLDKSKDPLVILEGKRTFIAEQFRRIRTSLAYLGVSHAGKKRVLVTSSLSGEGKSFVALNLALSLAMTGKKVILLELDLANPSLSNKLDVKYEKGVSDYLMGECEPEEVIKRTTANNNLFFLPCGSLPDNPSELIMNDRLKDLLNYLEDIFDHVVIDSAPASLLTDAYVLSPMCHATIYVVKHKFTPKVYLERLEQENSVNQLSNVGIVFNGIRSRGFTKNGYGYGYGYGYIHDNSGKGKKKKNKKKEKVESK